MPEAHVEALPNFQQVALVQAFGTELQEAAQGSDPLPSCNVIRAAQRPDEGALRRIGSALLIDIWLNPRSILHFPLFSVLNISCLR